MRILLIHPNYHSGGAEIAGNWPPAWVAYLTGYLKAGGYSEVLFVDAMTHHLSDDQARERIVAFGPDIIGATAITPAIYTAENLLKIAKEVAPNAVTVLGGIHGTFMYPQVLKEAPWIDVVVRGEGNRRRAEPVGEDIGFQMHHGPVFQAPEYERRCLDRCQDLLRITGTEVGEKQAVDFATVRAAIHVVGHVDEFGRRLVRRNEVAGKRLRPEAPRAIARLHPASQA